MTPGELDARRVYQIRENLVGRDDTSDDDVLALCDALEAAWAERDQSEALFREQAIAHVREHERAERAATLAAELMQDVSTEQAMTDRANAALAAWHGMGDAWAVERDRAERAEAEVERLRGYAQAMQRDLGYQIQATGEIIDRAKRAERVERWRTTALDQLSMTHAALNRVRDLCDLAEIDGDHLLPREVRAAIEGDNL